MIVVHVLIQVKPEYREDFITASIENATASIEEPGIARFDLLQLADDPNSFVLNEVYRKKEDTVSHKATEHYKQWNETVGEMMAIPRTKQIYENVFPLDVAWGDE